MPFSLVPPIPTRLVAPYSCIRLTEAYYVDHRRYRSERVLILQEVPGLQVPGVTQGVEVALQVPGATQGVEVALQKPGATQGVECLVVEAESIELGAVEQVAEV